jgi:hypothetical protein
MNNKKVQLNLYVSEEYRDLLQRMAAERMLKNPKRSATASKIGAEILCEYLERLKKTENQFDKKEPKKEAKIKTNKFEGTTLQREEE